MRRRVGTSPARTDRVLVNRTAVRLGLQTGALVAVVVVALAAVLSLLLVHEQRSSDQGLLHHAANVADDTGDPPANMWLAIIEDGDYAATPGLPPNLPYIPDLDYVERTGRPIERTVRVDGYHVEVLTQARPAGMVQAILNLHTQDELQTHIIEALLVIGTTGLVASACVGWFSARRAVRPLASALALQREFVADASHELRTPLTLLSTRAQLLHRDLLRAGVGATEVADAQGVVTDAGRLADVVDDLLAAADPRGDQVRQSVDLHTIARDVIASTQPYADTRQVRLILQPADTSLLVAVTVTAVRRALLALVDNAVRHTPAHGEVVLGLSRERTVVRVTVTDSGAGIPASQVPRLFRRFASGEQQASRRGYGLGLFLARDVADRHGGQLRLLSTGPGEGASFAFELPAET